MAIPPGGGAPTHFHQTQEETHILLEGRYEFLLGDRRIQVGPGDIVYVPKGIVHGFTNNGSETGRLLFIETPAGPLESFLEEIGEPVTDDGDPRGLPPDMVKLQAAAERTGGIDFV
jgi:mannose-6-phosphate isomerase-like protein (cupin superfamily)